MTRLFKTIMHGHRLPLSDSDVEKASFFLDLPETSQEICEAIDKFFDANISSDPDVWWDTDRIEPSDDFVKPNKAESAILEILHLAYDVYELDPKTWHQIDWVYSESHINKEYTQIRDKEGAITLLTPPNTDPADYKSEMLNIKHSTSVTQTPEGLTMSADSIHLDGAVSMSESISKGPAAFRGVQEAMTTIPTTLNEETAISHPEYYNLPSGRESKDVIRDILGDEMYEAWLLGTSIKYLMRYKGKEDPIKDLKKSKQYLQFIVELLEED